MFVHISDEILQEMCEDFERNIDISDDDVRIRRSLKHVWVTVNDR